MFKRGKDNGHDSYLENVNFQIDYFLILSTICCRYTLKLPQRGPTTYVFSINMFFTISFFKTNSQPLSFIQRIEHVEMNNFSCSLSCTRMTIIDCLFYASGSLS